MHTHKQYGSEIIALIPVATNTMHWKHFIFGEADAVCFLFDTRLKFLVNGTTDNKGAPMACAMVYWGGQYETFYSCGGFNTPTIASGVLILCFKNSEQ